VRQSRRFWVDVRLWELCRMLGTRFWHSRGIVWQCSICVDEEMTGLFPVSVGLSNFPWHHRTPRCSWCLHRLSRRVTLLRVCVDVYYFAAWRAHRVLSMTDGHLLSRAVGRCDFESNMLCFVGSFLLPPVTCLPRSPSPLQISEPDACPASLTLAYPPQVSIDLLFTRLV
jgi:hypothetical protein